MISPKPEKLAKPFSFTDFCQHMIEMFPMRKGTIIYTSKELSDQIDRDIKNQKLVNEQSQSKGAENTATKRDGF